MSSRKTIKIKLCNSNGGKLDKLEDAYQTVQTVAQEYLLFKQTQLKTTDFTKDMNELYKDYRVKYPNLNSAVLQQTFRRCDEMVKSQIAWCKKKHKIVSFPTQPNVPIILRDTNVTISKKSEQFECWLALWRTKFPLQMCEYHMKNFDRATKCVGSKITRSKNGEFIIHLALSFEKADQETSHGDSERSVLGSERSVLGSERSVLGVDLGISKPIVCSDGKQIGNGATIRHKKLEFGKKRSRNQCMSDVISDKQRRWQRDMNHKLSRELVNHCLQNDVDVLHLEDLKGHKLSNKKYRKYSWAFKELIEFVKYKAEYDGIKVISVDPAYTSQTCNCCGHISKENRKSQEFFHCVSCGMKSNADANAANNIRDQRSRTGASDKPMGNANSVTPLQ